MKHAILRFFRARGVELLSRNKRLCTDAFAMQRRLLEGADVRTVFDCGAHLGRISRRYREMFPAARVFAFEPTPATFASLCAAVADDPMIEPVNAAVGAAAGDAMIGVYADETCNSLLPVESGPGAVRDTLPPESAAPVRVVTLDAFTAERGIDRVTLLKMDIEGYELQALQGAAGLLAKRAIDLIYAEVRLETALTGGTTFAALATFLAGHGYLAFGLYDAAYDPAQRFDHCNAIFVSRDCFARYRARFLRPA